MTGAPRRMAASRSSRTRIAAASPMTKPSRSRSKGRDAVDGSSLRCDRTLIMANAPNVSGASGASAPPASATSTVPARIAASACPIAVAPDAHEFAFPIAGPRISRSMATFEAAAPPKTAVARVGETPRTPRVTYAACCSSPKATPPRAEPIQIPVRPADRAAGASSAWSTAMRAAATAKALNRSSRRARRGSRWSLATKSSTWAAMRDGKGEASKRSIVFTAERFAMTPRHSPSAPCPTGVIAPIPVTTTRLTLAPRRAPARGGACDARSAR